MGGGTLKMCRVCKSDKPIADFYKRKRNKGGFRTECKDCHGKAGRRQYLRTKPHTDLRNLVRGLSRNYGITLADWTTLYHKQHGLCAICKNPETRFNNKSKTTQKLCVDHSHKTGKIRGLLCNRCNTTLGRIGEDLAILKNMLRYMEAH